MSPEEKPGLPPEETTDAKVERVKRLVSMGVTVVRACSMADLPRPTFYFKVPADEIQRLRNQRSPAEEGGPVCTSRPQAPNNAATCSGASTSSLEHPSSQQTAESVSEPEPVDGDAVELGSGNR